MIIHPAHEHCLDIYIHQLRYSVEISVTNLFRKYSKVMKTQDKRSFSFFINLFINNTLTTEPRGMILSAVIPMMSRLVLLTKLETVYTGSSDRGSSMLKFNMEQGPPVSPDWLYFYRMNAVPGKIISGGLVIGKFPPHEAFVVGGTNSVRGYEKGTVGSGRSYVVGSGEVSLPLTGPVAGVIFDIYGTDL